MGYEESWEEGETDKITKCSDAADPQQEAFKHSTKVAPGVAVTNLRNPFIFKTGRKYHPTNLNLPVQPANLSMPDHAMTPYRPQSLPSPQF